MTLALDGTIVKLPDVREMSARVEADCPGVTAWYGRSTRAWWALVPAARGWRLVEAVNPRELREAISAAGTWPWPRA